jgi:hypothetical protein
MAGLGLVVDTVNVPSPAALRGLLRSAYDCLCLIYTKNARAVLTYARSYTQKSFFGPPSEALVTPPSIQKPSQKHQNLTSVGLRSRSPFFLCPIQNLKAVTMGMVTARVLSGSNKPNPAITAPRGAADIYVSLCFGPIWLLPVTRLLVKAIYLCHPLIYGSPASPLLPRAAFYARN